MDLFFIDRGLHNVLNKTKMVRKMTFMANYKAKKHRLIENYWQNHT